MPQFIEQLGQQAAQQASQGLVGSIMGLALAKSNDKRQVKQQRRLTSIQVGANKELSDYNYAKQLQMWKDTNYDAQVKELEKAGLNPGLLYGMGGAGGATTGGGAQSAGGGTAPSGGGEIMGMTNLAMQNQMMTAQKELIQAQAENVRADTKTKLGVDTELKQSQIANLTQDVKNKIAQEKLTQVQTYWQHVQTSLAEDTYQDTVDQINYALKKSKEELEILKFQRQLDGATLNDKIKIIQQEAIGSVLTNLLTKQQTTESQSRTTLNTQQTAKIKSEMEKLALEISQMPEYLSETKFSNNTARIQARIQEKLANFQIENPEIWKQIGGALKSGSNKIENILKEIDKIMNISNW